MCACGTEVETTEHFLLRWQFYSTQRLKLFENLEKVKLSFLSLIAKNQVLVLVYGSQTNNSEVSVKKYLKTGYTTLKQLLVLIDH